MISYPLATSRTHSAKYSTIETILIECHGVWSGCYVRLIFCRMATTRTRDGRIKTSIDCMYVWMCCSLQAPKSRAHPYSICCVLNTAIVRLVLQKLCVKHINWRRQNFLCALSSNTCESSATNKTSMMSNYGICLLTTFLGAQNIQSTVAQSTQFNSSRVLASSLLCNLQIMC